MKNQETLKDRKSNGRYMWVSSGGCERCNELDGTIYNSPDDIPDRPHPNCRCYVEFISNNEYKTDAEIKNINQNIKENKEYLKGYIQSNNTIENINNKTDDVEIKYEKAIQEQDEIDELNGDLNSLKEEVEAVESRIDEIDVSSIDTMLKGNIALIKKDIEAIFNDINIHINNPKKQVVEFIKQNVDRLSETAEKVLKEVRQYGIKTIVKIVKENDYLKDRIKNVDSRFLKEYIEKKYDSTIYNAAKQAYGPDVAGILDVAHIKSQNPDYLKNATSLGNYNDNRIKRYSSYLKRKVEKQFESYENIDPKNVNGYYFHPNSELSQRMAQSKEFKEAIKNKELNYRDKEGKLGSIGFNESNFYYAFHFVDIIDRYYDENGKLHIVISDTNEYNKKENSLVETGRQAMQEGYLKPLYFIVDVEVKDE